MFISRVQRPVRIMLDRNEDMLSTGGRHPFLGFYKVGFTSQGRITALDLKLYNNGGFSEDLSREVSLSRIRNHHPTKIGGGEGLLCRKTEILPISSIL